MKITKERAEYIRLLTKNLPPFTITFTDPVDASWLVSACIGHLAGTDKKTGDTLSLLLGASCRMLGIEEGVGEWAKAIDEASNSKMPKFIKPLLIHHFNHIKIESDKLKKAK